VDDFGLAVVQHRPIDQPSMTATNVTDVDISSITYSILSSQEIRKYSVVGVTNAVVWNEKDDAPVPGGVLDEKMGPAMNDSPPCETCGGTFKSAVNVSSAARVDTVSYTCPGHQGHIELPAPIYLPTLIDALQDVLRVFCYACGTSLLHGIRRRRTLALAKRETAMTGLMRLLRENAAVWCKHCEMMQPKVQRKALTGTWFPLSLVFSNKRVAKAREDSLVDKEFPVTGVRARCIIDRILNSPSVVPALISDTGAVGMTIDEVRHYFDSLTHDCVVVMPPCTRSTMRDRGSGGRSVVLNELTKKYRSVVVAANILRAYMMEHGMAMTGGASMLDGRLTHTSLTVREAETLLAVVQFHMDTILVMTPAQRAPEGVSLQHVKHTTAVVPRLKGKTGRFRANIMGKRVDFSGRTVISPDPNIPHDSLAIPLSVAAIITVEERVTPLNRERLERSASAIHEGETNKSTRSLFDEDGLNQVSLFHKPYNVERQGRLRVGMIVERPLRDGDVVLFNRQPTLHGPSMMALLVVIHPRSSFGFGLSKTKPFNADFDGDEMNIFVPQSLAAQAEARQLMMPCDQLLLQTTGAPCMGLVQDSLLGAYLMSKRDAFFDRGEAMTLMMHGSSGKSEMGTLDFPKPAVRVRDADGSWRALWTGKQLLSLGVPECVTIQRGGGDARDSELVVRNGRLLAGRFNKNAVGAKSGSIFHVLAQTMRVSHVRRRELISATFDALEMMCKEVHTMRGFSVGLGDMMLECRRRRNGITCRLRCDAAPCHACATELATHQNILQGMADVDWLAAQPLSDNAMVVVDKTTKVSRRRNQGPSRDTRRRPHDVLIDEMVSLRERSIIAVQTRVRDCAGKLCTEAFAAMQPDNAVIAMDEAGSKGAPINLTQMNVCVGGQCIEGNRTCDYDRVRGIPLQIKTAADGVPSHGVGARELSWPQRYRTTAHSLRAYPDAESGGFVPSSFIAGLEPLAFFFAAAAGRQGLIDTTQNTSKTGYLQRKSVKGGEDVTVTYDGTVRNSDGRIIQTNYGAEPRFVERKIIAECDYDWRRLTDECTWRTHPACGAVVEREASRIEQAVVRLRELAALDPLTGGTFGVNVATLNSLERTISEVAEARSDVCWTGADVAPAAIVRAIERVERFIERLPVVDDVHSCELRIRLATKTLMLGHGIDNDTDERLAKLFDAIKRIFVTSRAEPGFPAGVIMAQSMGEPATQMTLNSTSLAPLALTNRPHSISPVRYCANRGRGAVPRAERGDARLQDARGARGAGAAHRRACRV